MSIAATASHIYSDRLYTQVDEAYPGVVLKAGKNRALLRSSSLVDAFKDGIGPFDA